MDEKREVDIRFYEDWDKNEKFVQQCLNEEKEMGYNPWTIEMIRETGNGQCADLRFNDLNEGDFEHI